MAPTAIERLPEQRAEHGGAGLLGLVDRRSRQRRVVEENADGTARTLDRGAGHPAPPEDARLVLELRDPRAILEHGPRRPRRRPIEDGLIVPSEGVHDVVLVDGLPSVVGAPSPDHGAVLFVDEEDGGALERNEETPKLHGMSQEPIDRGRRRGSHGRG